ncbi:MAG: hypothetical protein ACYTBJ_18360 [Planctomycetota bacterium]|jgi:hypothetical protein
MRVLLSQTVTIRKSHECADCRRETLPDGATTMRNIAYVDDSDRFHTEYICNVCWSFVSKKCPWFANWRRRGRDKRNLKRLTMRRKGGRMGMDPPAPGLRPAFARPSL